MLIIIFIATTLQCKHKKDFHHQRHCESDSVLSMANLPSISLTLISILGGRQGVGRG